MAKVSPRRISQLLAQGRNGRTRVEQGKALEDLICYIFERVPGITLTIQDEKNVFETEELDLPFWNDRIEGSLPHASFPDILLVECKNWSSTVESEEVSWFVSKLRSRGLPFGMLVAANGITGRQQARTAAYSVVAQASLEGRRIVQLTETDLTTLRDTAQLVLLLKRKLCQLVVSGAGFYRPVHKDLKFNGSRNTSYCAYSMTPGQAFNGQVSRWNRKTNYQPFLALCGAKPSDSPFL
jgi:hypothetical protein